jgi:hypothetical protein
MAAIFTSPKTFLQHLAEDDQAFSAEVDRVNALPDGAIPNADLLGFSHMLDAYHQFANAARAKAEASSVLVSAEMSPEDEQLIVFERQLREWQDHTGTLGHAATTPIVPRDDPSHPQNEPGHGGLASLGGAAQAVSDAFSVSTGTKVAVGLAAAAVLVLAFKLK